MRVCPIHRHDAYSWCLQCEHVSFPGARVWAARVGQNSQSWGQRLQHSIFFLQLKPTHLQGFSDLPLKPTHQQGFSDQVYCLRARWGPSAFSPGSHAVSSGTGRVLVPYLLGLSGTTCEDVFRLLAKTQYRTETMRKGRCTRGRQRIK